MVNYIWATFIIIGILFSLATGNIATINETIIKSSENSLEMIFKIFPVMALWMGLMNIASQSGLLTLLSNKSTPLLGKLFPEIPKGHESLSLIASNIIANIFGLGSAATPFGLKAMEALQKLNPNKTIASRSMITFLVINTSGVTIIPTTIISLRMMHQSHDPTIIVLPCLIATICSTVGGILFDRLLALRAK